MSINYLELQKLASQMLKEFGKTMTLRKSFIDVDGPTGDTTEIIIAQQEVTAVQASFEHRFIDGSVISVEDVRFYLGADNLHPDLVDMEPIGQMKLIDNSDGRVYQFKHARKISPGDVTVLYGVQAF